MCIDLYIVYIIGFVIKQFRLQSYKYLTLIFLRNIGITKH